VRAVPARTARGLEGISLGLVLNSFFLQYSYTAVFDQVGRQSTTDVDEYTLCFRLVHSYDHLNQAGGWLPPLMGTGRNGFRSAEITSSELPLHSALSGQRKRIDVVGLSQAIVLLTG